MAIIVLAHNGIGLGHLSRSLILCEYLKKIEESPILIAQGFCHNFLLESIAGKVIEPILYANAAFQKAFCDEINNLASLSCPSLIIEDTHPTQLEFSKKIRRILIVRPTTFQYLLELRKSYESIINKFLVADDPNSPTWPYNISETEQILSWKKWEIIGPLYRSPTKEEIEDVFNRIIKDDIRKICLFTLGGGGQHLDSDDVNIFIKASIEIAQKLKKVDSQVRYIFVKGPHFPKSTLVPSDIFEVINYEPYMPALIALSYCVVLRAGFNTTWECIQAKTRMLAIEGTSYEEPISQRVKKLFAFGLIEVDPEIFISKWNAPQADINFRNSCDSIIQQFSKLRYSNILENIKSFNQTTGNNLGSNDAYNKKLRVLIIAINGIGIGHVLRCIRLALALQTLGHLPYIIVESNSDLPFDLPVPGERLPRFINPNPQNEGYFLRFLELLDSFDPHILIYDTHRPINEILSKNIRFRYLIGVFSLPSEDLLEKILNWNNPECIFLLHSKEEFFQLYGEKFITQINNSSRFLFAGGPILHEGTLIFKSQSSQSSVEVPKKHFILFIIGGGGDHLGVSDTEKFSYIVNEIAKYFSNKGIETVFIGGPHFKHKDQVDRNCVTYFSYLCNINEFINKANVVIVRPGFNTTREIFDKAKAILILKSYQFNEASEANLKLMQTRPYTLVTELNINEVINKINYLLSASDYTETKPLWEDGTKNIIHHIENVNFIDNAFAKMENELLKVPKPEDVNFMIRIDDVVENNDALIWLLNILVEQNLCASLEIIPYLNKLNEVVLEKLDPKLALFEVSQHGFAHLIKEYNIKKSEFGLENFFPEEIVIKQIIHGYGLIKQNFYQRFRGGFSPPFDGIPNWLPSVWQEIGGYYISIIWAKLQSPQIPIIRISTDVWDWNKNRLRTPGAICSELMANIYRKKSAGIVLHPQHFEEIENRKFLINFLKIIKKCGLTSKFISEAAKLQSLKISTSRSREYNHQIGGDKR